MTRLTRGSLLAVPGLVLLLACGGSGGGASWPPTPAPPAPAGEKAVAMPLLSQGLPASASSGDASQAVDGNGDDQWRSTGAISAASPAWIAVDLSTVPAAQRQQVLLLWRNDSNYNYDASVFGEQTYNQIQDYTVQSNSAAGGGAAPTAGWSTLVTVVGNTFHSRQHLLGLAGANWVRISVTAVRGTTWNYDAALNLELHDASKGVGDSWIFFGDSITAFAMGAGRQGIGAPSYAQLVHAGSAAFFPSQENGGIGGTTSADALANLDRWLALYPGRFVCLSYGTNDVNSNPAGVDVAAANFEALVQKLLAAGKLPCIPHVPWAPAPGLQQNAPALNAKIDLLYTRYPQIVRGPDLWTVFLNQGTLFRDELHPNEQGILRYRQAWADAMLNEVYK